MSRPGKRRRLEFESSILWGGAKQSSQPIDMIAIESGANSFVAEDLSVYDDPVAQRSFVRASGHERQAQLLIEGIRCAGCSSKTEKPLPHWPASWASK